MEPIIEILARSKAEQDRFGTNMGCVDAASVWELENCVVELTNQSDIMQDALNDIVHIAAQLKANLISSKKFDGKNELTKLPIIYWINVEK